jgi:retinol dehydrogenase 12
MTERERSTYAAGAPVANESGDVMRGRVCVVTGASSGIGRATATALARLGTTVVAISRDATRGATVVREIVGATGNERVSLVVCDLSSMRAIERAATEIEATYPALHALVNNAGVSLARRQESDGGVETTLAVNHLAPFVLTQRLAPMLERGAPSRVVNVTSQFARWGRLDFADLESRRRYNGTRAYLQSKLANIAFTMSLSERLQDRAVRVLCVYPRLSVTKLLADRWWWRSPVLVPLWRFLFDSAEIAARSVVGAVVAPDHAIAGATCLDSRGRSVRPPRAVLERSVRERLWMETERILSRMPG